MSNWPLGEQWEEFGMNCPIFIVA